MKKSQSEEMRQENQATTCFKFNNHKFLKSCQKYNRRHFESMVTPVIKPFATVSCGWLRGRGGRWRQQQIGGHLSLVTCFKSSQSIKSLQHVVVEWRNRKKRLTQVSSKHEQVCRLPCKGVRTRNRLSLIWR